MVSNPISGSDFSESTFLLEYHVVIEIKYINKLLSLTGFSTDISLRSSLSRILNDSSKGLKVAHLNICSLRYKIDELRLMQRICGFVILGISETHLDSSVPDNLLQIDGLQFIRRDRTKCSEGCCLVPC